jgi:hypothetical protein
MLLIVRVTDYEATVNVFTEEELRKRMVSPAGGRRTEADVEIFFHELLKDGKKVEGNTTYYPSFLNWDGTEPEGGY